MAVIISIANHLERPTPQRQYARADLRGELLLFTGIRYERLRDADIDPDTDDDHDDDGRPTRRLA